MSAAAEAQTHSASCFCGAVSVKVEGAPIGTSACHCQTCRALSGAPFMANVLFSRDAVSLAAADGSAPATIETRTSKALVGHFKSECTNPALFKEVLRQVASKDASGVWQLNEGFDA